MKRYILLIALCATAQAQYLQPSNPPPQIRLSWDASQSPNITNYWLYIATNSGQFYGKGAMGTNLSVIITNLARGKTYYFSATSQNWAGLESSLSSEVSVYLNPLPEPPLLKTPVVITAQTKSLDSTEWCDLGDIAVDADQTNSVYRVRIARAK